MSSRNGLAPPLVDAAVALLGTAGRSGAVRVLGESMRPTLAPGSVLYVEFSPERLSRGDLLLFRQADFLAVHRLVGRTRRADGTRCLRTRGDNVLAFDPPVDPSLVVGRATAVERDGAWRDLRSPAARAYAALLALHDFAWTAAGALADRTLDRAFRGLRVPLSARRLLVRCDRAILRVADRLLFRAVHATVPPPPGVPAST